MSNEQFQDFSTPKRQSPAAILSILTRFVRQLIGMFWVILVPIFVGNQGSTFKTYFGAIILGITGVTLVLSIISYFKYYYFVDETSFNIHKGVLGKKKISLPFERIQNVNFEQNLIQQLIGVVSLQIDSAGSAGSEIKIDALPMKEAETIRDYILEQKREITAANTEDLSEGEEAIKIVASVPDKLILKLGIGDLIKVGVSQNHIRTAFIILGIGWGFMDNITDLFKVDVVDVVADNISFIGNTFLAFIIVFLFISFLITLVRTVLTYFNLHFYKSQEGYKVNSGLFTRQEVSLREEKIQVIRWTTNPLRKIFGIFTLDIKQAIAGVVANRKQKAEVPGCYQNQVDEVLHSCFEDYSEDNFSEHQIDFSFVIRYFLYIGIIPMIGSLIIYYFSMRIRFLIFGIVFPFFILGLLWIYFKKFRLFTGNEYIQIKKGIFGTAQSVMPYYKVQAVELIQTIYQRRKGLANVQIHTANGTLSIPYFNLEKARQLQNYVLYKVEESDRKWM